MQAFLTSSPSLPDPEGGFRPELNPDNGLVDALRRVWPQRAHVLLVASDPDCPPMTIGMATSLHTAFSGAGLECEPFDLLDARTADEAAQLVQRADVVVLAGGHVPTQNAFFHGIGLKGLIQGFDGIIIGISAGTMNSALEVYCAPELEGEASNPSFQRTLEGLGLTERAIVPHWQAMKDEVLDGLNYLEDIVAPDSMGRELLLLVDGSYLHIDEMGIERICGEAYLLIDGILHPLRPHMCQQSGEGPLRAEMAAEM